MSQGTDYGTKPALLDAVEALVYTNTNNEISADAEQTAMNDIIETLWPQLGGSAPISIVYGDLINLADTNSLVIGQKYVFDYQCKHYIPTADPAILNTASNDYVVKIEQFEAIAISDHELHAVVKSYNHIYDMIVFDFTANYVDTDTQLIARTGEVIYRKDHENNLETYYDFRGVYYRRGLMDVAASRTKDITDLDLTAGNINLLKGDTFTYNNGTILNIVLKDVTGIESLADINYLIFDDKELDEWLPKATFSVNGLNSNIIRSNTVIDRLTFDSTCQDIIINNRENVYQESTLTYPNITFTNCLNIEFQDGAFSGVHVDNSTNLNFSAGCSNSYILDSDKSSFQDILGIYMDVNNTNIKDSSGYFRIINTSNISSNYTLAGNVSSSTIKNGYELSLTSIDYTTLENGCRSSYLDNVDLCNIGSRLSISNIEGLQESTIGENCSNLDLVIIQSTGNTIGDRNTNITIKANCEGLTIGNNCNLITIGEDISTTTIDDVLIDNGCTNITISNANVVAMQMNVGNSYITLQDADFTNIKLGNYNDNISIIPTSGNVTDLIIGQGNSSFTFTSLISNSKIGNNNTTITSNVAISELSMGDNCNILAFETLAVNKAYIEDYTANNIYDGTTLIAGDILTDIIVTSAGAIVLDYSLYLKHTIPYIEAGASALYGFILLPANIETSFYVKNTDSSAIDVIIGADTVSIEVAATYIINVKKVVVGALSQLKLVSSIKID